MATQPGDKVKLEAMASMKSIPRATRREEFAVLVRVTAPPGICSRAGGVDIVALLDISGSMNEEKRLERMKQAMVFVIDQLGPDDRLSVVSFNDQVQRRTELSVMSDENRAIARTEVNKLTAPAGGGTNTSAATEAAATILGQRGKEERSNRVGRIIFLSNGDDPGQNTSPELTAEAFGLGADDNLSALSYVAEKTSGVYSYANQDVDKIKDTRGLTSVDTATAVQIDLQAHEGVAISSLESGGHRVSVGPDGRQSLTIYIHDLYAGEQKSFIVYLTVPEGKEELLTVSGLYRDPENSKEDAQLDGSEVSVLRPNEATPADETICPEVAAELDRTRLVKPAMAAEHPPSKAGAFQANPMEKVGHTEQGGVEQTIPDENQDMREQMEIPFPAKQSDNVTKQAKKEEGKLGKVKIMWGAWAWARSNPYSCCVALLLLGAAMLLMWKKEDDDGKRSSLDISQHPGWPKMEESLGLVMLKKMEDARITSFLHSASVEDMSRTMNRYIYLALVHASGVHVSLLEQTVEVLEAEKEELRIKIETLAEEKAEEEVTAAAGKDNDEALERANTRIVELERQLQDKKAFADSLRSEVANTDAQLKTCGQRVDMLEAKVREMESAQGC